MFVKYLGKFRKAEAEWVMEVLDMHGGDQEQARLGIIGALNRLTKNAEAVPDLQDFDDSIRGAFFVNRDWWPIGMERLAELGLVTTPEKS